jgi:hypothetical protein
MIEHPDIGDTPNAPVFRWCYKRMAEFIAQLVEEGAQPRVMLEYSGTLLHGLREMGAHDVLGALCMITLEPRYHGAVEWLGCPWGHAARPRRRSRTTACTSAPDSNTSPRCSGWRR